MNIKYYKQKSFSNYSTYANRGMSLEHDISLANEFYRLNDKAVIYKKPTPITIAKVNYVSRLEAVIKEAYFKTPSTTDYNGIYRGKYLDFEAKETKNKKYFPLENIHKHQIDHLKAITKHGGIGFIIVRFSALYKTYLLTTEKLEYFLENSTRKSIPLEYFEKEGHLIKEKYNPRLDYLEVIDKLYFDGGQNESTN